MLDDYGTLSVRTYTAGGALPVSDALVNVKGTDENNRFVSYSLFTDVDGATPVLKLPAPSKELSMTPTPDSEPYSMYNVEILAEGYLPKRINGVPVFPGVYSLLPVSMLPHNDNLD